MPRTRRMGLELWWKPGRSVSDTQRDSEKAWVDTENRSLYFISLLIAVQQVQHVRGHVLFSFEEDVAEDAVRREHAFHHREDESEEQYQQEAGEMKVPIAPSDEER
eukprot:1916514-Amphidinium_carterae.1